MGDSGAIRHPLKRVLLAFARRAGLAEEGFYFALLLTGAVLIAVLVLNGSWSATDIVGSATALGG